MTFKKIIFLFACVCFPFLTQAQDYDGYAPETLLIDVPTANVLDKYQASFTTRAYADGSIMESLDFGVIPQINIVFSLAVYELIGSSDDIKVIGSGLPGKMETF